MPMALIDGFGSLIRLYACKNYIVRKSGTDLIIVAEPNENKNRTRYGFDYDSSMWMKSNKYRSSYSISNF